MNPINDRFIHAFALAIVIMCFAYFFYISTVHFDVQKNNNVGEIKTAMISFVTMVIGYFFGASRGSQQKDDNINQLINKNEKDKKDIETDLAGAGIDKKSTEQMDI